MDKEYQERDCDSCIHYKEKNRGLYVMHYCEAWECQFKAKEDKDNERV